MRIEKADSGYGRWRLLYDDGSLCRKCQTRLDAQLLQEIIEGDYGRAPLWFQRTLDRWVKAAGEAAGAKQAISEAVQFGCAPSMCGLAEDEAIALADKARRAP